jgi:hypothetical protein
LQKELQLVAVQKSCQTSNDGQHRYEKGIRDNEHAGDFEVHAAQLCSGAQTGLRYVDFVGVKVGVNLKRIRRVRMGRARDAEEEEAVVVVVVEEEEEEEEEEEATASDKRPNLGVEMNYIFCAVRPSPTRNCVERCR